MMAQSYAIAFIVNEVMKITHNILISCIVMPNDTSNVECLLLWYIATIRVRGRMEGKEMML